MKTEDDDRRKSEKRPFLPPSGVMEKIKLLTDKQNGSRVIYASLLVWDYICVIMLLLVLCRYR